jgi:HSP20 family protein
MKPDEVAVQVGDDAITISGERHHEREEERGNIYRVERSYGAFARVIPLPEGAMVDQAKATFKDGVLEITVPAPPEQVSRGRRLEISQGDHANSNAAKDQAKAGRTQPT